MEYRGGKAIKMLKKLIRKKLIRKFLASPIVGEERRGLRNGEGWLFFWRPPGY
jgi:hypothetical protein